MTKTDDKLNEINSKLDKIDRKLDGPTVVDQYGELVKNSMENAIQGTVPRICFGGRSLRAKWPKWINYVIDIISVFIILIGIFVMVESKLTGIPVVLIGFLLLFTSTNKHLQ